MGPSGPGAGKEVPRCYPGLLHNPLLLWRTQRRLHCQWQRRYSQSAVGINGHVLTMFSRTCMSLLSV